MFTGHRQIRTLESSGGLCFRIPEAQSTVKALQKALRQSALPKVELCAFQSLKRVVYTGARSDCNAIADRSCRHYQLART